MVNATISKLTHDDVLCGRGGKSNNHLGNRKFRSLVSENQPEYIKAKRLQKNVIACRIVQIINERGGRFLRRMDNETATGSGRWEEIGEKKAIEKTSQALREKIGSRGVFAEAKSSRSTNEDNLAKRKTAGATEDRIKPLAIEKLQNHSTGKSFDAMESLARCQDDCKAKHDLPILLSDPYTGDEFYFSAFGCESCDTDETDLDIEPPLVDDEFLFDALDLLPIPTGI
uniref:DUF6824 domain-containing protein n=1 Tax=Helicotheca tamesis TaxID=374047 RepID=A0A7S2E2I8_9STRA|mmetsp:Transcript_11806/g.16327  ORF Transcript_11806/g.16327 Transcript_11806/m.16327 type:complete len:228 (+) Transcript_11806:126-809(+)|eukprot:CAMPEP_0185735816 /NCGR_PEP_ID=MMETSP1171-20130828/26256_1 /TAXON_ID=374046 /ORGANISM="Helicotheca tamensis, Strain CCMP826" /LENGTH=227 /DNA_ID=CAMNT_0028406247 /DNA_START=96 /DNA_END=779 /DNA_ORIENTATION=+